MGTGASVATREDGGAAAAPAPAPAPAPAAPAPATASLVTDMLIHEAQKREPLVVGEAGRDLYEHIRGFVGAKKEIDGIAKVVLPEDYMRRYPNKKEEDKMKQTPLGGGGSDAMTLADVFAVAARAKPTFERVMRGMAIGAELNPDAEVRFEGKPLPIDSKHAPGDLFKRLTFAPPKGKPRCVQKIKEEYGGQACRLVDVVRCSVVVDTEKQLIAVAEALARGGAGSVTLEDGTIKTADGDVYEVVRLKNRFAHPLFNGYRDALYSVRVLVEPGVWHVCEMQLHLAAVIAHKENTHVYYEYFRTHFAGNMDAADGQMKQLLKIGESGATSLEELVESTADGDDVARMKLARVMLNKMGEYALALAVARGELRLAEAGVDRADAAFHAGVLARQANKNDEAETLLVEARDTRARELGEDHNQTLMAAAELAGVFKDTARSAEAEPLYRAILKSRKKNLGEDHKDTLKVTYNLATLLYEDGRMEEAEPLIRVTYEAYKKELGEGHSYTLTSAVGLATVLMNTGRNEEAEAMYRNIYEARKKKLGATHPEVLRAFGNIGFSLLRKAQELDEAGETDSPALARIYTEAADMIAPSYGDDGPVMYCRQRAAELGSPG